MSRRNSRRRRKERKERKVAYKKAMEDFHNKYPSRGSIPGPTLLNFMAHFLGEEVAHARLAEAKDPFNIDNIFMEKKRKLYEEFKRNGNWKNGVSDMPVGWGKVDEEQEREEPLTYEEIKTRNEK
tara:strand:+ start:41 stop:415 length:375 start_codon:yes stop_codon:yes gene_type:complete